MTYASFAAAISDLLTNFNMRITLFIASLVTCTTLLVGCSFFAAESSPEETTPPPTVVDPFEEEPVEEPVEVEEEEPAAEPAIDPVKVPVSQPVVEEEEEVDTAPPSLSTESSEALLAQCLTDTGVKLYTAVWCGHCQKQKEAFKDGSEYLDNVECASDDGWATVCTSAGVSAVPTWIFPDGEKKTGNTPLATLASLSGCSYTTSS
jgi:hypothetical protein